MNAKRKVLVYIIGFWIAQLGAQQNLCLPSVSAKEKITKHRAYYTSYLPDSFLAVPAISRLPSCAILPPISTLAV